MKLTRKHLRDLIIEAIHEPEEPEEPEENKTMIPNKVKHNYLAVSHDENEQNLAREQGIPPGVIPHGYVVLDAGGGTMFLKNWPAPGPDDESTVTLVTHDDVVALSDAVVNLITDPMASPKIGRMRSLGITHIFLEAFAAGIDDGEVIGSLAGAQFVQANSTKISFTRRVPRTVYYEEGYLMPLDLFSEYHMKVHSSPY